MSKFERAILIRGSGDKAMALYQYFQPLDGLPDPSGEYAKFTPEQQAVIGEYDSLHGNQVAIRHFSKKLGVEMKVTSVQT